MLRPPLALTIVAVALGSLRAERAAPVDLDLREEVEVRRVLVDLTVVDRSGATVPDLAAAHFELRVDGDEVPIESFDARCPIGAAADARPGAAPEPAGAAGRIVLAFDWSHLAPVGEGRAHAADAIRAAAAAVEGGRIDAQQLLVASIGDGLRIEQPFTADRAVVLAALRRMEGDGRLLSTGAAPTEFHWFRRMMALLDLLEREPGRKLVVLFSGPIPDDGWTHDNEYDRLAAMAATARVAFYPVDSGGLRTLLDRHRSPLGGPPRLRRLADDTGGRMTADTNDLSLGPARASRDLGCSYTLGFRDVDPVPDRPRRLGVRVTGRRGARALHPASYVVRGGAERSRSLLATAALQPGSFASDEVRIAVEIAGPVSRRRRAAVLRATFPAGDGLAPAGERELRGFVRRAGGEIVSRFTKRIAAGEGVATLPLSLRPGRYETSVVVEDPATGLPAASVASFEVPPLP